MGAREVLMPFPAHVQPPRETAVRVKLLRLSDRGAEVQVAMLVGGQEGEQVRIRVMVVGADGRRTVHDADRKPGDRVDLTLTVPTPSVVMVFAGGRTIRQFTVTEEGLR